MKNLFSAGILELKNKLIDTSRRNKLINYKKPSKARNLKVIDESSEFILQYLIQDEKVFKFQSIPEPEVDYDSIEKLQDEIKNIELKLREEKSILTEESNENAPENILIEIKSNILKLENEKKIIAEELKVLREKILLTAEERARELGFDISNELPEINLKDNKIEEKYIDDSLQTLHYPNEMEKILTNIERNAKSIINETGSNMLYLVLGVLEWYDSKSSEIKNKSPLINIPVILTKEKKKTRYEFTLSYSGEGLDINRSLAEKLSQDFGIVLPELTEDISFNEYMKSVQDVISTQKKWQLKHEISLDFLRFGKILMYQDLKEENWVNGEGLVDNPILQDIFVGKEVTSDMEFAEEYDIDHHDTANQIPLVMDADSSQHSAIVDVLEGKNVIIEGPPGTGKSQTISNIIAALLAEGKSVLFVSEKLAALEVVYKRLDNIGVGDFCLELHSNKSQKLKIFDSIKNRLESSYPDVNTLNRTIEEIEHKKIELQQYIDVIHQKFGNIDEKIYDIFWLREKYYKASKYLIFNIPNAKEYSHKEVTSTVEELEKYCTFHENYDFNTFYWKGLDVHQLNFIDIDIFVSLMLKMKQYYIDLNIEFNNFSFSLDNEYTELEYIVSFIDTVKGSDTIAPNILACTYKDSEYLRDYVAKYSRMEKAIVLVESSLEKLNNTTQFNDDLITVVSQIYTSTKDISYKVGLERTDNLFFIKMLRDAVEKLKIIDKDLYLQVNEAYVEKSFPNLIVEAKKQHNDLTEQRSRLKRGLLIDKVDSINFDEINNIKRIILEKKDSFFNFFSGEYKAAKNKLLSLYIEELPDNKDLWITQLTDIITYKQTKIDFEANSIYRSSFDTLFSGLDTDWSKVDELYEWVKTVKQDIKLSEIQNILLTADDENFQLLNKYNIELNPLLEQFNDLTSSMNNYYTVNERRALYSDIEEMDLLEFRNKIEFTNESIDENINKFKTMFSALLDTDLLELNNIDSSSFQNISCLENTLQELNVLVAVKNDLFTIIEKLKKQYSVDLNISENTKRSIDRVLSFYEEIQNSKLDDNIKTLLIKDYSQVSNLEQIKKIKNKLDITIDEIEKYGTIDMSFYGDKIQKIAQFIEKLEHIEENKQTLSIWSDFNKVSHAITVLGLGNIVDQVENKYMPLDMIVPVFYYNFYNTLIQDIFRHYTQLNSFTRLSHEQAIEKFKELDKELIQKNRQKVAYLASQRDIPYGYRGSRKSDLTELALIQNEVGKQKRHIPIRQLVKRAPNALKGLKPCFMMSPLSVSQYLPPNEIKFDVLVVDEASQLRPEESLGCIARAKQIVIVGDPKQLPPTSFFQSIDKNSDEDETLASESESILDICLDLYKPIRRLRWHYRSQHESLIDFSNHQFYDGNLIIFPSPTSVNSDELGIKHHYIDNAFFQNRRNKVEAKIIIEHIEQQMKRYPDKSIGVGTFNSDQRDLIQDLFDEKERSSPIITSYLAEWKESSEPFFIKNLENLQGDERDVIFISTTYGKDKDAGKVHQRFGPINTDTGWRRLNVMFTRAKQKMEVFTSMLSSDINVGEHSSRGVRALKAFLRFVETGKVTHAPEVTGRGFDSEFEESVYNILSDAGYKAVPQVGVAGYFIDLSVTSEKNRHDYILAIECDGATYHSSKSARDRDRLKQDVLENLGWTVYRIWSVDWYKNRENEISKLLAAVKNAQDNYKEPIYIEPGHQTIVVEEVEEIDENIDIELEKEVEGHQHTEETIVESKYTQMFLSDDKVKEMLIELRDNKISKEFDIDRRSILSDLMIELFVKYKPINMDEFRKSIPMRYRNEQVINIDQMKYINEIFDILELADE